MSRELSRERWAYIKALRPSAGRYLHVSAPIIQNPARALEMAAKGFSLLPELVVGPTETFNAGRNLDKRMKRAATKARYERLV
jgi:hypothetical protein